MLDEFLRKTEDGSLRAGVIGLGYVGLPLLMRLVERGINCCGFDIDEGKILSLTEGRSYIRHVDSERLKTARRSGLVRFTSEYGELAEVDAMMICVPTPLKGDRTPELKFVEATAEAVAERLRPGRLVALESTTYPGTTREVVLPRLEKSGLKVEEDFFLAYCPEREDPGNIEHPIARIPRVTGGIGPASLKAAAALYRMFVPEVMEVSSPEAAEASKLLENVYRAVNIALVNEFKIVLDSMGIDVWEVIRAAATKPFGFHPFYPGPGWGGHCIPVDPFYLSWRARTMGMEARFIEDAGWVNEMMPRFVVEKTARALEEEGRTLRGSRVLVLGLAYKKNVDDDRMSPAYEIMELLQERGAEVVFHDPFITRMRHPRAHPDIQAEWVELSPDTLEKAGAVIIVTDHDALDRRMLAGHARLIVDTRNFMDGMEVAGRLVKA